MTRDATAMARAVATIAHLGQVDKAGVEYIRHPERVAAFVAAFAPEEVRDEAEQVAWLHDVVEDTNVTLMNLLDLGFSESVVNGVKAMTKRNDETTEEYFARVRGDRLARIVKSADISDNTNAERLAALDEKTRNRLMRKYDKSRKLLEGE